MAHSVKKIKTQNASLSFLSPTRFVKFWFALAYFLIQKIIIRFFKPALPKSGAKPFKPYGRIAVIGAGLTGVSSAAHAISHGFEVVIYEAADGPTPGGIWANVNSTSGLQLNSLLYRFHPGVIWRNTYPHKDEVMGEITRIWKEYRLEKRTRFNTRVTSVRRAGSSTDPTKGGQSRWVVNDASDGKFDAVIVAVGTCGSPRWVSYEGMPSELRNRETKKPESSKQENTMSGPSYAEKLKDGLPTEKTSHLDGTSFADKLKEGLPHEEETSPHVETSSDKVKGSHPEDSVRHSQDPFTSDDSDGQAQDEEDLFTGPIIHSSQLDDLNEGDLRGKTVAIVGGGASAVEAAETALSHGAAKCIVVARDDKWIIPRNIIFDTLLACQPFGREMPLSFLWERGLKRFHYYGAARSLVPKGRGLFEGTPIVNDAFLDHVRAKKCEYLRGTVTRLRNSVVVIEERQDDEDDKKSDLGKTQERKTRDISADILVLATGFEKPQIDFLPKDLFPENYERPNLYLQNFSTEDWSILMTNSSYTNAIGTVGHFHIGIYTRILLTLIMDKSARPSPKDMKLWVDAVRFIKRGAKGGALGFFTYAELCIWFAGFLVLRPDRLRWMFFIMQGWGVHPRSK